MYNNVSFGLFFLFLFNSSSVFADHWILNLTSTEQLNSTDNAREFTNTTNLSEDLKESSIINTTESDNLFWIIPKTNDTVEEDQEMNMSLESENANNTLQIVEDDREVETNDTNSSDLNLFASTEDNKKPEENNNANIFNNDVLDYTMDEKIVLERHNCHLEIALQKTHDLKLTIKFGKLESNTSGKCCITLNGGKYSKLGVFVSNIHLYQKGEVLKVIMADYGSEFVLKEYYSWTKYQPLLLTETNKVYIVLYYKVGSVSPHEKDSQFNLEVITYGQKENYFHQEDIQSEPYFLKYHGTSSFPQSESFFTPYQY